jgi:hypothetical protein
MSEFAQRARALHQSIRTTLLRDWDPIGVSEIPEAQDEYDAYVPEIHALIVRRRPVAEIFDYLIWAETEHMGLSADRQKTRAVAEALGTLAGS